MPKWELADQDTGPSFSSIRYNTSESYRVRFKYTSELFPGTGRI